MNHQDSLETYRKDFPSLERRRNGKPPVYLDNACTTLVPRQVIAAMDEYYTGYPSCGGRRSHHWFAEEVTHRIEGNAEQGVKGTRQAIAEFIHAGSEKEIIIALNTTHAINTVALGFKFKPGDVVLLTDREHNSNLLPWLRLQKLGMIQVVHTMANHGDSFDIEAFESHFKGNRVRLVSLAWTSNVTGATLPAKEIIAIAHRYGARVLLDGAQTVPHQAVDVCDVAREVASAEPPTLMLLPGCRLSLATSSRASPRTNSAFQSTRASVLEKTILGIACQIRA
jgi:cysteine desulfurase / selenocysteine lyase